MGHAQHLLRSLKPKRGTGAGGLPPMSGPCNAKRKPRRVLAERAAVAGGSEPRQISSGS
jgi:hypothetical protein